ncbi:MAG: hypothetical protein IPO58_26995 [Betaproteobacteria bacterium]|nr:hypothetical protein [Betaproteobacteria bacterium]
MIGNVGPSNASASPSLSDTLPAGTSFRVAGGTASLDMRNPAVSRRGAVSCNSVPLAPLSALFTLVVNIAASLPGRTVLSNTATASSIAIRSGQQFRHRHHHRTHCPRQPYLRPKPSPALLYAPAGLSSTIVLTNNAATPRGDNPGDEFVDALPPELVWSPRTRASGFGGLRRAGQHVMALDWREFRRRIEVTITIQARVAKFRR